MQGDRCAPHLVRQRSEQTLAEVRRPPSAQRRRPAMRKRFDNPAILSVGWPLHMGGSGMAPCSSAMASTAPIRSLDDQRAILAAIGHDEVTAVVDSVRRDRLAGFPRRPATIFRLGLDEQQLARPPPGR